MRQSIIITRIFTVFIITALVAGFSYRVFATTLPGTVVTDILTVGNTTFSFAVADSNYLKGGHMQVADRAALFNRGSDKTVTEERRSIGMLVTVLTDSASADAGYSGDPGGTGGTNVTYRLISEPTGATTTASNWKVVTPGSESWSSGKFLTMDGSGNFSWGTPAGGGGINADLSNLDPTAINVALLPGTSNSIALGSSSKMWSDLFLGDGAVVNFNAGDVTLTHSADTLTLAGGSLVLPDAGLTIGSSIPFSDASGTLTLQNIDAVDATTTTTFETAMESAIDSLDNLNRIQTHTVLFGGDFTTSGASALTLTTTGATDVTFPTTGTLATLAGSEALTNKTLNGLTVTSSNGTLTVANGSTLATSGANSLTLTTTGATNVTFPTSGTLYGTLTDSITSLQLATSLSDETGSGLAVFGTSPTFTTDLTTPLIIGGTGTTSTLTFKTTSGVGTTNADMIFQVGNNGDTEAMRILNSGYVGVGSSAPVSKFDVTTSAIGTTPVDTSGISLMNLTSATNGQQQYSPTMRWRGSAWNGSTSVPFDFHAYVGAFKNIASNPIGYLNFGSAINGGTYSDGQLVLNSLGNVAIGTTTPLSTFEVVQGGTGPGTVSTSNGSGTVTGVYTQFLNTFKVGDTITVNGETRTISAIASSISMTTDSWTGTNSSASYTVDGSGTRFVVKGNGNVGIGAATPSAKLEITDTVLANSGSLEGSALKVSQTWNTSGNPIAFLVDVTQAGISGGTSKLMDIQVGGTSKFNIDGSGLITSSTLRANASGATDYTVCVSSSGVLTSSTSACTGASSIRFKHDVEDLTGNLDKVLAMRPVSYKYNETNADDIGFIAEEILDIDPRLVVFEKDGVTPHGLKYDRFTSILAGAIQELDLKIAGFASLDTEEPTSLGSLIKQFLADNILAIKDLTASVLRINGEVCVEDVCVSKEQFKALLQNAGGSTSGGGGATDTPSEPDPTPTENTDSGNTGETVSDTPQASESDPVIVPSESTTESTPTDSTEPVTPQAEVTQ